ncbi:hypothetical protein JW960_28130 [candidate division KSB1 bacterium]|nr:hypothetical protein [candidate division KSB1 bacterium]
MVKLGKFNELGTTSIVGYTGFAAGNGSRLFACGSEFSLKERIGLGLGYSTKPTKNGTGETNYDNYIGVSISILLKPAIFGINFNQISTLGIYLTGSYVAALHPGTDATGAYGFHAFVHIPKMEAYEFYS